MKLKPEFRKGSFYAKNLPYPINLAVATDAEFVARSFPFTDFAEGIPSRSSACFELASFLGHSIASIGNGPTSSFLHSGCAYITATTTNPYSFGPGAKP